MKIWPEKYEYEVCPYCGSKRIKRTYMKKSSTNSPYIEINEGKHFCYHYKCSNCERIFHWTDAKEFYDRKEMRRDIKRLIEFLEKK